MFLVKLHADASVNILTISHDELHTGKVEYRLIGESAFLQGAN